MRDTTPRYNGRLLLFSRSDIIEAMYIEVHLGDIVRLRKKHPCGSFEWEVVRLGADIGLVCQVCRRRVLLQRGEFNKQLKAIITAKSE
jgi:hypothetical protein